MDIIPSTVGLTTYDSGKIRVAARSFRLFGKIRIRNYSCTNRQNISLSAIVEAHPLMESNMAKGKIVGKEKHRPIVLLSTYQIVHTLCAQSNLGIKPSDNSSK